MLKVQARFLSENAINAELQRLHTIVEDVKNGTEVTKTAMWNEYVQKMHDDDLIRVTREAAIEEGRKEGIEVGREEGELRGTIKTLVSLVKEGTISIAQAADQLGESEEKFSARLAKAK